MTDASLSSKDSGENDFSWESDESLRRAAGLIEKCPALRAVSFDFFDTLVFRLAARPTDVFIEVGRRLRQSNGLPAHVSEYDYEVLRCQAEMKAREQQQLSGALREDVTFDEILRQLKFIAPDTSATAQNELAAEGDFCLLNPQMLAFARHARRRGLKLFVISDIYLSAGQLGGILRANHFDPAFFDGLFTSSDAGICKWSGKLFSQVLKQTGLKPEELLHLGDNVSADVAGARRAGVRGCHYVQATTDITTALEREQFLLGSRQSAGSVNSLRLLAARNFPGATDGAFFGRAGALLLGPLLARWAGWACEQFTGAGVCRVGAFMREGEILGELLRREATAAGRALDVAPLYANRKSTDLAAIGQLTAKNLMDWVGRRQTLPARTILKHFGVSESELQQLPFSPDEKIDSRQRLLQFAEFLFTPKFQRRIEERSAEERRKIMDYLRPWLDSGPVFGVCDIGYNATAQMQLQRIFDLEGCRIRMTGCYLVTCEVAARRSLDGLDVRHFLGAFGRPGADHFAFLRSPAFVEQSLVAACGTTLGYERDPGGTVRPVLDEMRFPPELLQRQRAFKDGVLHFQKLWLHFRAQKPGLLDGTTEFSHRLLADIDAGCAPILARATAFPTRAELAAFSALPLDDQYFTEGFKTISGEKERQLVRDKGYDKALADQGVLWPQAASLHHNPNSAGGFFTYGNAMLLCRAGHDNGGLQPAFTVILPPSDPEKLRASLRQLTENYRGEVGCEIIALVRADDKNCAAVVAEFRNGIHRAWALPRPTSQSPAQHLNLAGDHASAPLLLFLDDSAQLAPAWNEAALALFEAGTGAALLTPDAGALLLRRLAWTEALGFAENLSPAGMNWQVLLAIRELGWQIKTSRDIVSRARPLKISAPDKKILATRFPEFEKIIADLSRNAEPVVAAPASSVPSAPVIVDWIGSFLDHGSLSHVNRELTAALAEDSGLKINRVGNGTLPAPGFDALAREISTSPCAAAVTVRHAWPPNWQRPAHGKLAVIQPWEFGSLPQKWVQRARDVDEFWVPSSYVRDVYIASGVPEQKVVIVPNGVNTKQFHPQVPPMKLATQKKFKFLFVGGTIGRKGPDLLLQAYLRNFTGADDVCLVIKDFGGKSVYAGQTFDAQISAAQAIANSPEILYLNEELPPEVLPGLYAACDCFVLPYRGEGFGLPILEAMACGLPVIVTAGGATDDFVRDEFGWRVPAVRKVFGREVSGMKLAGDGWLLEPDRAALGQAMRQAGQNPGDCRERGRLASRHAQENWSWTQPAKIIAQRIQKLAGNPQPVVNGKVTASELPSVARVGQLNEARQLFGQKKLEAAWNGVATAITKRPFHPEAFLLLAEIAAAAGDANAARQCAQHARELAPEWSPAKQFLKKTLKGGAKPGWLKVPAAVQNLKAGKPRLSVCLIVKNEEKFLAQCLKSVREMAQQLIIVDTGSTDRTVEIAKEFGAEIYTHPWNDDFAAARNAALEHATGDWILMLDADEEIPAGQSTNMLADINNVRVLAYRLPLINAGKEAEGRSFVPRLARNVPGAYYTGRIHEQVFPSLIPFCKSWGLKTAMGRAKILHHGYNQEMMRDRNKIERNLKLLQQACEEDPTDVNLVMNLGLELVRSGDLPAGVARYREAFRLMSQLPADGLAPELREVLLTQFTSQLYKIGRHEEVVEILNSPLAKNGGLTASLHFALGLSQFELTHYSEAAEQVRECLAKRKQPALSPVNTDILTSMPNHCLALALQKTNDPAGAERAFQAALTENGRQEIVKLDYAKFLAGANRPVEALHAMHELVAANCRNNLLWRTGGEMALSRPEFLKFACDWTGEAMRYVADDSVVVAQRAEALMLSGDTAGAAELWEQVWNGDRQPKALAALILCEAIELQTTHAPEDAREETSASMAFIAWYQRLISMRAKTVIDRLNEQMDKLSRALPTAAGKIEAALAKAQKQEAVAS